MVKLQSPASSSNESDGESQDPEGKSNQKDQSSDHLDAFLPTFVDNREEKDLSLLKALKHDLAAKAKQCLEKKKSVSEQQSDPTEVGPPRVGESRERNIQIQQAKMASLAAASTTSVLGSGKGIEFTTETTVPEEPIRKKEVIPAPSASGINTNQMKKDIHDILTTVGACRMDDSKGAGGHSVAVSLAKSTILSAVDNILKEKIAGTAAEGAVSAGKSGSASRSRSRSRSRSHR